MLKDLLKGLKSNKNIVYYVIIAVLIYLIYTEWNKKENFTSTNPMDQTILLYGNTANFNPSGTGHIIIMDTDTREQRVAKLNSLPQGNTKTQLQNAIKNVGGNQIIIPGGAGLIQPFTISSPGTYNINFEVFAPSVNSDSFLMTLTGQGINISEVWHVNRSKSLVFRTWKKLYLAQGNYGLHIQGREATGISKVQIKFVPTPAPAPAPIPRNIAFEEPQGSSKGYNRLISSKGFLQASGSGLVYHTSNNVTPALSAYAQGQGPFRLVMQNDRNLVVYDRNTRPIAATGTDLKPGDVYNGPYRAILTDDHNLTIVDKMDGVVWTRPLLINIAFEEPQGSPKGYQGLITTNGFLQASGSGLVYHTSNNVVPVLSANAPGQGQGPFRLVMQNDRNLVVFDKDTRAIAATGTDLKQGEVYNGPYRAVLTSAHTLMILDKKDKVVWSRQLVVPITTTRRPMTTTTPRTTTPMSNVFVSTMAPTMAPTMIPANVPISDVFAPTIAPANVSVANVPVANVFAPAMAPANVSVANVPVSNVFASSMAGY